MRRMKQHKMLWLIVGIPLTSVLMGVLTLYLATGDHDGSVPVDATPLSKTSWKAQP